MDQPTRTLAGPAPGLSPGALVSGRYEILGVLGQGGMGRVYRVLDREIGEEVAIKLLSPEAVVDPRAIERFRNELKLARQIVHKNVCRIYHIGEDGGTYYLVMELVRGEDLRAILRRDPKIDPGRAVTIARQICEGLAEAHRLGIVHRDLKPGNIMIDGEGNARIMDFGIARSLGSAGVTAAGALVGTPEYMSPEQVEGRPVDARSDIYSLGALLFEMAAGRPPFEAETRLGVALKRRTEDPPDPRSLAPGVPEGLSRIILKCLARDPAARYKTAEDVTADLDAVRAGRPVTPPRRRPFFRRWPRPRLLPVAGAAVLAAAALIVLLAHPRPPIRSIAVLPLQNLSGDPGQDYFADGITEDIITQLSKIGELKVISRTSVWRYKTAAKSVPEIGRELDVGAVLEGSVRREGDRIRIVGQLVDARTDRHIWAETYDRTANDLFAIQSEVAERIARELRVRLSPEEKKRIGRPATANLEAYGLYAQGREHYYRYTKDDNEKAIELFRKAVALDPSYALAYAGLGDAYAMRRVSFGFPADELDAALAMSRRALDLDPELAEGHKALGLVLDARGDVEAALGSYYRAAELNPNYAPVVSNIGSIQYARGRYDEAVKWLTKAVELQPGVPRFYGMLALPYFYLGDDAAAGRWLKLALELQPEGVFPRLLLAYIDLYAGRIDEARARVAGVLRDRPEDANALDTAGDIELVAGNWEAANADFQKLVDLTSWEGQPVNKLAFTLIKLGRQREAEGLLRKNLDLCLGRDDIDREGSPVRYHMAEACALLGRPAEALDSLDRAAADGYYERWIAVDPLLAGLRGEARFREIMGKFRARIEAMRRRLPSRPLP
jgi:serine/threonine protein kinase/tetratricopeptide (TPR) repeat protein